MSKKEIESIPLEDIIANTPQFIFWKDVNSVYLGCNENFAFIAGLKSAKEIVGKTDYDLPWGKNLSHIYLEEDRAILRTGQFFNQKEVPLITAQNEEIIVLVSKKPLFNKQGKIIGILGIYMDITERVKMEEELFQAQKAAELARSAESASYLMTEFVSNMGHDLATPISDVGGIAQLLLNYVDEYPEFKEDFEILATRSEDCEKVRQHILNATSIANLEIKPEKFSTSLVLLALEKELSPTIGTKNLKIIIHPLKPKKADFIVTDRIKFHDILFDLVSNAINFTEAGEVSISIIREDDLFHIKVSDTGIGIPTDKFDYIFQQYTKLSRSNKYGATFKGVGAGLYLAKIRANILNATISVESEVGKGSTFTLSIPTVHSDKKD